MRTRLPLMFGAVAALSVSGCATEDGVYGSGGYAYGTDSPYGYSCYGSPYGYGSGAYGYGDCGWYDGFFYPGFGGFVFDRHHQRHEMTMRQHDYFTRQARGPGGTSRVGFGSSGGAVPPGVSQQPMMGSGMAPGGRGDGGSRSGFDGQRSGFGGQRGGFGGGARGGGGFRGGRSHS